MTNLILTFVCKYCGFYSQNKVDVHLYCGAIVVQFKCPKCTKYNSWQYKMGSDNNSPPKEGK